jgi:phospho-N-acetylmuramoyl-pentapeptide-transferase
MFYYLSQYLLERSGDTSWAPYGASLDVLRYITVRTAGAAITALLLSWWLGPRVIAWLKDLRFGQHYLDKAQEASQAAKRRQLRAAGKELLDEAAGPDPTAQGKRGVPSMGGVLIVLAMDTAALLWAQWNAFVLLTLLSLLVLAGLGFYDDYVKVTQQNNRGVHSRVKWYVQVGLALAIGIYLWRVPHTRTLVTEVMVPFYREPVLTGAAIVGLGVTVLAIVGSSNAVNLTDGLDGLAIGCTLIVASVFAVLTYVAGNFRWATYLQVPYVPGAGELTVFCGAMIGAGIGFLWYNCHPAQVFMGDTGSLALGGAMGIMGVLIHQPFILVIAGGVFVAEAVSVMLQVGYYKLTKGPDGQGKRIFLMSPLHHHFREKGWSEPQVVTRFYILGFLCAVIALSSLKLR